MRTPPHPPPEYSCKHNAIAAVNPSVRRHFLNLEYTWSSLDFSFALGVLLKIRPPTTVAIGDSPLLRVVRPIQLCYWTAVKDAVHPSTFIGMRWAHEANTHRAQLCDAMHAKLTFGKTLLNRLVQVIRAYKRFKCR
jgi:hypothetical protein